MRLLPLTAVAALFTIQGALTLADIASKISSAVITIQAQTADGTNAGLGLAVDPSATIATNLGTVAGGKTAMVGSASNAAFARCL
jgi:hypothetical protein